MSERPVELNAILSSIGRRWTQRARLRAWTLGAATMATVVLAGVGATLLLAREGMPLVVTTAVVLLVAAAVLARTLWSFRYKPTNAQLARFVEERSSELEDVVVTAVDYAARPDSDARMRELLAADAARSLAGVDLDRIVPRVSVRQALIHASVATAVLALALSAFAPRLSRATTVAAAHLFPARLQVEVTPGTTKVRVGQPLTITARVSGLTDEVVPTLSVAIGEQSRQVRMLPTDAPGVFGVTIQNVSASFAYNVSAAGARSDNYIVTVIRPPRVERIDLHYDFPQGLGLEARTDEDSGDIYGPAGTKVRLTVVADKPIAAASLVLNDGTKVPLNGPQVLSGALTIDEDGSYRVALADQEGLENAGDTEYFIRTLADRPPDVRILRPASDKKVTPLEEVPIEVRADDDYGVASLDLVFQAANGKERVVPLRGSRGGLTASSLHTLFMEDLGVQPGDFVTYYARARDVSRGRRSTEARSDIFFLEVKPFEEEFVAAQSQTMGQGAGMQGSGLEGLAEAQKQIIVATWKLDARARRARDASSQQDIKAIAKAQGDLRTRAEQAAGQPNRAMDQTRRGRAAPTSRTDAPLTLAVQAMGRAAGELDQLSVQAALPHEMEALNQLLKAEAEVRRRQVSRQQQAGGGGGGMNRAEADLSSLFDQELRRRQETNYETPNSAETRQESQPQDDPLERIRELARRQDALNRQQRELDRNREQMEEEELKRQLERLTREQNELRQQAEQLAQRMQQQGSRSQSQRGQSSGQASGQSGQSSQGQQSSKQLRDISEEMRNAATGMRRQDQQQANAAASRAAEKLRELEQQMQASGPDNRRRAIGDMQLESRQLADAQRRVANEAARTAQGQPGDDARRRLAGEQERLAERAKRLQENAQRLSRSGEGSSDEQKATADAARELERQNVTERMRESAAALRQPGQGTQKTEDIARVLDRVAERLGAAAGAKQADARRLSDQLSKSQELREKLAEIDRTMEQLQREGQDQSRSGSSPRGGSDQQGQASSDGQQGKQAQQTGSQQGQQAGQQPGQQSGRSAQASSGEQSGSAASGGGRLGQLQRDATATMRDAERLAGELRRENPNLNGGNTEAWWRSVSAPGTEAFKQDFAKWESLKKNLLIALEDVEAKVSNQLRARENEERLNAGGHHGVSDVYRGLVDKYYRSLAVPRQP
jgi:hypothetical protein